MWHPFCASALLQPPDLPHSEPFPLRRYRLITEAEHHLLRNPVDRCDYYKRVDELGGASGKGAAAADAERNPDLAMQVGAVMPRMPLPCHELLDHDTRSACSGGDAPQGPALALCSCPGWRCRYAYPPGLQPTAGLELTEPCDRATTDCRR